MVRPDACRNLSFGKLACRLIGGAWSGTVGIEEATFAVRLRPELVVEVKYATWTGGQPAAPGHL
jgi:hypothetical protein